jgi:CDP-diglyceride synthetase
MGRIEMTELDNLSFVLLLGAAMVVSAVVGGCIGVAIGRRRIRLWRRVSVRGDFVEGAALGICVAVAGALFLIAARWPTP